MIRSPPPFFEPSGIAVVDVSTSDSKTPENIIFDNLIKLNRRDLFTVNPKGGIFESQGKSHQVHVSLEQIPGFVDLAIVTVPAAAALSVVEVCARKGVKAVILIPGGFSEVERHRDVEDKIKAMAAKEGLRVMGSNCLGIISAGNDDHLPINIFFVPEEKFIINFKKETNVALFTQSGALGLIEIANLQNAISPRVIVSYGNQLDVDPCDLLNYFQKDPGVDVIGCYIEGFKPFAGREFFDIAGVVQNRSSFTRPAAPKQGANLHPVPHRQHCRRVGSG